MKEWKLRILIVFSFLSIAGLMLIQAYWIHDAIDIKESHFKQTVNKAVTNVVWQLERLAIAQENQIRNQMIRRNRNRMELIDSIQEGYNGDQYKPLITGTLTEPGTGKSGRDTGSTSKNGVSVSKEIIDSIKDSNIDPDGIPGIYDYSEIVNAAFTDSLIMFINRSIDHDEGYRNVRNYLESLLFDEMSEKVPGVSAVDILDSIKLSTLILEELEKEGLRLKFRFGVYLPFTGNLLFCDSIFRGQLLNESDFVYSLFPNFKLSKPAYLVLSFPGENRYLFSSLGKVLSLSFILTVLLIWSFYFITRNTYRQKKLGEMKNDFINNMTHEFKTPVSTISLACEALRDKDIEKSGALIDNYLYIIDEENKRLGKLAEQILQTAIIDKGHLYLAFEQLDIHGMIQQVIDQYTPVINQQEGKISTKLFAEDSFIKGDRTHLYNMISNLIDNAIKYSAGKPEIEILTTGTTHNINISIQDKGIGISKANQKRIFEKLYRVPTGNVHNTKGFGLGLSYVKYIVERHQGSVHVESELTKGSRFVITLPRQPLKTL